MKITLSLAIVAALWIPSASALAQTPEDAAAAKEQQPPLRIFLRGGPKTHGPADNGVHDHPGWVRQWQPLLKSRGAEVVGELRFPTAEELENTDVLVMFLQDGGTILGEDRANFEAFLQRGGGVVVFHDALVTGREPHWFKTIVGGAWENRVARYYEGENTYYFVNTEHPITKGAANFAIDDEVYWNLHMMPSTQILASTMEPARRRRRGRQSEAQPETPAIGRLIPQIWVYENQLEGGEPYRAYVNLLGHHYRTFSSPHVRAIMLRGIAWAGKRDADLLTTPDEVTAMQ